MEIVWNLLVEREFISILKHGRVKFIFIVEIISRSSTFLSIWIWTIFSSIKSPFLNLVFLIKFWVICKNIWLKISGNFILRLHVPSKLDHAPELKRGMAVAGNTYWIKSSFKPYRGVFSVKSSDCYFICIVFWLSERLPKNDVKG